MSKKLSKVGLVSLLLAMCALFGAVFFGCNDMSRLTNSWSGETKEFAVGQTAEQALASIEVKYDNKEIKIFEKKNNVSIILDTRTKTAENEVRTCTITYEGQSTSFKYIVTATGSSSNSSEPSTKKGLTSNWTGQTKTFTIGETKEDCVKQLKVYFDGVEIDKSTLNFNIDTSTATLNNQTRICNILYKGSGITFYYKVVGAVVEL